MKPVYCGVVAVNANHDSNDTTKPIKKRTAKKNLLTQQEKDDIHMAERMARNREMFDTIRMNLTDMFGKRFSKENLLKLARAVSSRYRIPLDRLAKRVTNILICWFCENWTIIQNVASKELKKKELSPDNISNESTTNIYNDDNFLVDPDSLFEEFDFI